MNDFCIIVQGPSTYLDILKPKLTRCGVSVIYSTWESDKNLYTENDLVVISDKPHDAGPGNINYQRATTLAGLYKARELGYKRALKLRSDMEPTHPEEFIKLFDNDNLNFFCWHYSIQNNIPGYMVDYFMSGPIDNLIEMWSEQKNNHHIAEIILTSVIVDRFKDFEMSFVFDRFNQKNDVLWLKYDVHLSIYETINSGSYFKGIDLKNNIEVIKAYASLI